MDEDIAVPDAALMTGAILCSRRKNDAAFFAGPLFADLGENYSGDEHAIHRRWPDHLKHGQRVLDRCRRVFHLQARVGRLLGSTDD
jgi:hypothetical protein